VISGGYSGIGAGGNSQYATDSFASATNAWTVTIATGDNSWSVFAYCSK
jgi:hypothetical protein